MRIHPIIYMYLLLILVGIGAWIDATQGVVFGKPIEEDTLLHIYMSVISSLYIVGLLVGKYIREYEINRLYERIYLKKNG